MFLCSSDPRSNRGYLQTVRFLSFAAPVWCRCLCSFENSTHVGVWKCSQSGLSGLVYICHYHLSWVIWSLLTWSCVSLWLDLLGRMSHYCTSVLEKKEIYLKFYLTINMMIQAEYNFNQALVLTESSTCFSLILIDHLIDLLVVHYTSACVFTQHVGIFFLRVWSNYRNLGQSLNPQIFFFFLFLRTTMI